jgi:hypothetical protein
LRLRPSWFAIRGEAAVQNDVSGFRQRFLSSSTISSMESPAADHGPDELETLRFGKDEQGSTADIAFEH